MNKLIIIILIVFSINIYAENTTNKSNVKVSIVKVDSLKRDTSKAEKVVVATDKLVTEISQKDIPEADSDKMTWLIYISSVLVPLLLQWFIRIVPTASNWKLLQLIELLAKLLVKIAGLISKVGNLFPNKKKGGGNHDELAKLEQPNDTGLIGK